MTDLPEKIYAIKEIISPYLRISETFKNRITPPHLLIINIHTRNRKNEQFLLIYSG